jgi:hypothetical protein
MLAMQQPKEKITKEVEDRLEVCQLIHDTNIVFKNACNNASPFALHLDPHADLMEYSDIQIISYLCHSSGIPLSLAIGGCEANRDLQELASLNVATIQVPCIESCFALNKFIASYNKIYDVLEVPRRPEMTLLINTPGSFECLGEIFSSTAGSLIQTLLIDRNALATFSIDDDAIVLMLNNLRNVDKESNTLIGICGGISPLNVEKICRTFNPNYISTKMFTADAAAFTDNFSASLVSGLLVLEARVIDLILRHRNSMSTLMIKRRHSLINYIQASVVRQLTDHRLATHG